MSLKALAMTLATVLVAAPISAHPQSGCTLRLRMDGRGRVFEAHHRLSHDALVKRLQEGCGSEGVLTVLLHASPQAKYGAVFDLTELVKQSAPAGTQFAIVGQPKP